MKVTRLLDAGSRLASLQAPTSIDLEKRTATLIWSTGSTVFRNDPMGAFYESLSMAPEHVNLTRLKAGAPLLASHDTNSLESVLGIVESVSLKNGIGEAVVRFSADPAADAVFKKVQEGIIKNVSIGYSIRKMQDISKPKDKVPTYQAVDWTPYEISLVTVPADPNAQVRSQNEKHEAEILPSNIQKEDNTMSKRLLELEIQSMVRAANLGGEYAKELIGTDDMTVDKARALVMERLEEQTASTMINSRVSVQADGDNHSMRRLALEQALLHRMDSKNFKVTELSRGLFGQGLIQQAQSFIPRNMGESDVMYAKRALSTSDFALTMANVAEKSLQNAYGLQPKSYKAWTKADTVRNFKPHSQVAIADFPELLERKEGGEFQFGSIAEKNEVIQLADYGRMLSFTYQSIINDDLSALQKLVNGGGIAAARLDNKLAYSALRTNKQMADGVVLYHANHNNLGTAAVIGESSMNEAYKAMMRQTSVGSLDPLNLQPKYLICGPDKFTEAKKFLAQIQATQTANVNPFSGSLELVVDAEIPGNEYYFACDPSLIDTVTLFRLEGVNGPLVENQINFMTNGLDIKVSYSVAAGPMDYRGLYKNSGL